MRNHVNFETKPQGAQSCCLLHIFSDSCDKGQMIICPPLLRLIFSWLKISFRHN